MSTISSCARRSRVVFISGGPDTPGHHYRVRNIASALEPEFEAVIIRADELRRRFGELSDADILWVWRTPYSRKLQAALDAVRDDGALVVFDIDDLVFRPELAREVIGGNRNHGFVVRTLVRRQYKKLQKTLVAADHCTAPTEPLAREMRRFGKPATVVPNGFDATFLEAARDAVARRKRGRDEVVRIGYAAGTFTHQRDLAVVAPALRRVLAEHSEARFVAFEGAIDLGEFPDLLSRSAQIEQRPLVPLDELPHEYARFDVNIAPLEVGNPFCEAKSELKYFEAALAGAVTIASPTEPFATSIRHGETGFLATDDGSWQEMLTRMVVDARERRRVSEAARHDVSHRFGPERRSEVVCGLVHKLLGTRASI